jgi:subtilisin-like proprotein convertase family protein
MWDLDGALKSPSGEEVRLFSRLCNGSGPGPTPPPLSSSTLFGFSDEATSRLGGTGCPGSVIWQPDYGPSGSEWGDGWGGCPMTFPDFCPLRLSDMAGDPSSGTWTLDLRDNVVGATESGTLAAWSIEILRPPVVFPAPGLPLQVPDNGTASSSITVPASGPSIAMLNIGRLRFAHDEPDGVSLTLVAPDGRTVPLTSCGNVSAPWIDPGAKGTTLSDESLWPPFSCGWTGPTAHTPGFGLAQFQNRSAAGTWTLRVQDTVADGIAGQLLGWSIVVFPLPATTIDDGPAGATAATDATFRFGSDQPDVTYACSLDGADFAGCTSPQAYTALAAGIHTFRVRATDSDGNTDPSPAERSWTVSLGSPPPTVASSGTTVNPKTFTARTAFRLPSTRRCLKPGASLKVTYLKPKAWTITRFEAWIGKKRLTRRTGASARRSITLRKLPTKRFTLTIKVTPKGGQTATAKSTYRICGKA